MRPAVWAPQAQRVRLQVGEIREPMRTDPQAPGWWCGDRNLRPGERYGFSLDDGPALPDPRSFSLPDGVHGLSRCINPGILRRDTEWPGMDLRGRVLYELHVGTFTDAGTLDAAITRLDVLAELGIDAIELMPLAAFPGARGWGYDGVAPYSVHETYGGPEALARFIDAAHERGLGVLLDMVYNHLGPEGNYLGQFGPYFTDRHHTPWGEAVNLDGPGSDGVRQYLIGAAAHFLVDLGVDGLRLDAVHALLDDSEPHFLTELSQQVGLWSRCLGRPLTLFAESDLNQPSMIIPVGSVSGARGMDGQWADDVHHALHSFFSGERQGYYVDFGGAHTLAKALTRAFVHDGGYSTFRRAAWGAPVDPSGELYDGHSFVVSLQNHDQIGNRAVGDRFAHHAGYGAQAAAAALYLLGPFTPMLFMGEEWAASAPFPYFSDLGPALGPLITQGRAREFAEMGWSGTTPDPQAETTFTSAKLDWSERTSGEHARMLSWYRRLLSLRRVHSWLRDPSLADTTVEVIDECTVVMRRGPLSIVATRGESASVPLVGELLTSWGGCVIGGGKTRLEGPGAAVVGPSDGTTQPTS